MKNGVFLINKNEGYLFLHMPNRNPLAPCVDSMFYLDHKATKMIPLNA